MSEKVLIRPFNELFSLLDLLFDIYEFVLVFLELHLLVILGLFILHIAEIGHPLFFFVNTQLIDLQLKFYILFQHIFIVDSQS